jgi:predicted nucleic acid-binding protein
MTTAIDTNVIVALWDADDSLHRTARAALDKAFNEGTLVISGAAYAELMAAPGRTEAFVDGFCEETGIAVEWEIGEREWRAAGTAFQGYAARRRKQKGAEARRILADFVIGAHALVNGYRLLTLDAGIYQASFPKLAIATV